LLDRIEIRLFEEDSELVTLRSLTSEALESFLLTMNSLRVLSKSLISSNNLTFTIEEGSARGAVLAPESQMRVIYNEIDLAIKGESLDKDVTGNLRIIQNQLKNQKFGYTFNYTASGVNTSIHERIINSKRISITRKKRSKYKYELKVQSGYFNQLGGKDPNYHFDFGSGDKLTIECSIEQAKLINSHIYSNVSSLLLCKKSINGDKKDELFHMAILKNEIILPIKNFLHRYNNESGLVERLTIMHDFVDSVLEEKQYHLEILKALLIAFNDTNFHLSEFKTLLVISKPFKDNQYLKKERASLFETYSIMKSQ